jgi:hypothetical protein
MVPEKSNVLEAIALASAASARKLTMSFLASRGIRVTAPTLMRSAFKDATANLPITVTTTDETGAEFANVLYNDTALLKLDKRDKHGVGDTVGELRRSIANYTEALPQDERDSFFKFYPNSSNESSYRSRPESRSA